MGKRSAIAAACVPAVLSDDRIRGVMKRARLKLPAHFDFDRFAFCVRLRAVAFAEASGEPTRIDVQKELKGLYDAIEVALNTGKDELFEVVALLVEKKLSPQAHEVLRWGLYPHPTADMVRDPRQRDKACKELYGRCASGARVKEGRNRSSGRKSRPTLVVHFRPSGRRGRPKAHAEFIFAWTIRCDFLNAGGHAPFTARKYQTSRHEFEPGPFVRMLEEFLSLVGASSSAIALLNRMHQRPRRLSSIQQKIYRAIKRSGPKSRTEISKLLNRHSQKAEVDRALAGLQELHRIVLIRQKSANRRGRPPEVWASPLKQGRG